MAAETQLPESETSALERFYERRHWYARLLAIFGMQSKLTFAFIFLVAVSVGSYGFVSLQDTRRQLKDNLTAQAKQASTMLATLAAEMPGDMSPPALRRAVGPFIRSGRDLLFVTMLEPDGAVILTETPAGAGMLTSPKLDPTPGTVFIEHDPEFGPHVVSTTPIQRAANEGVSGFVRVGVSLQEYAMQTEQTTYAAARVGVALILLAVPISFLLVRRMFKPIRRLVRATQLIAAGDMNARVPAGRRDVIGDLARAFNEMVLTITQQQAALKDANQKLHDANRDLEQKIEQRTAQLETANKRLNTEIAEKEDFLRAISHDLNAPLRNISGMVTMVQNKKRDQLDDDTKHRLERIKKNVEVETDLINELLELSRIKTRRGQLETFDLESMVWDLRGVFENDLRTKDINLTIDSILPSLNAERPRIRQVFQNLIDNAIKYMGESMSARNPHRLRATRQRSGVLCSRHGQGH
ncbi:MAG: HAMP domain-containing protein [Tepidisphaeraceae bacterium]